MKYTIDYGLGEAILYTPYDAKERFHALAGTCFGIRKSIMHCVILRAEEIPCEDFERLEFNGDVYVWREDGARKMVAPLWAADKEWDMDYCEMVRYKPKEVLTMSKEYIEREDAKARLRMWITDCVLDGDNEAADRFRDCIDLLDSIPAADVTPVRPGRWIEEDGIQICSECGEEHEWEDYRAPYCDTCGAKMNKEETDELD